MAVEEKYKRVFETMSARLREKLQAPIDVVPPHAEAIMECFQEGPGMLSSYDPAHLTDKQRKQQQHILERLKKVKEQPVDAHEKEVDESDEEDSGYEDDESDTSLQTLEELEDENSHGRKGKGEREDKDREVLRWLNRGYNEMVAKHNVKPLPAPAGLRVDLMPHQQHAETLLTRARVLEGGHKGLILGDAMGLGKTLTALTASLRAKNARSGPDVVVCPSSLKGQWALEIEKYFEKGALTYVVLEDDSLCTTFLWQFDVVITSYNLLSSELRRMKKFSHDIRAYKSKESTKIPTRPNLPLLSEITAMTGSKFGSNLILDEAQYIKNRSTGFHAACLMLRQSFDAVVMLTGTPLDNTFEDLAAYLDFLENIPIHSKADFIRAFTAPNDDAKQRRQPVGKYKARIIRALDIVSLMRPKSAVRGLLPNLYPTEQISVVVNQHDLMQSNACFAEYMQLVNQGAATTATSKQQKREQPWAAMFQAMHWLNHPKLPGIMTTLRKLFSAGLSLDDEAELPDEEKEKLKNWKEDMRKGDNWRSDKIEAYTELVEYIQFEKPDDAIVIMEEFVLLLDIIQIGLERMKNPPAVYLYNGRLGIGQRAQNLMEFREGSGFRVLLMSRATGGVGLNIPEANHLIHGIWWKQSWVDQAIARLWRPGAIKDVRVYEMAVQGALVDIHRAQRRDEKNELNQSIEGPVRREYGAALPPREIIE